MVNPLGTGTSVRTFPETVVVGLKSDNTLSLIAFFEVLNATGWNRKFSCLHEPRVNRVKSLRVRSTNLDERVQVSHSFVIRALEINLPPRAGGGTGSYYSILKLLLDLCVLGEIEEGKGQCVGTSFV